MVCFLGQIRNCVQLLQFPCENYCIFILKFYYFSFINRTFFLFAKYLCVVNGFTYVCSRLLYIVNDKKHLKRLYLELYLHNFVLPNSSRHALHAVIFAYIFEHLIQFQPLSWLENVLVSI